MTVWNWLTLAGIPTLTVTMIVTTWVQVRAVKRGVQALLRDRLMAGYKFYRSQGWADEDDRSNLENVYVPYHALGANGVMDDLRDKFLSLPVDPPQPAPNGQAAGQPVSQPAATGYIN